MACSKRFPLGMSICRKRYKTDGEKMAGIAEEGLTAEEYFEYSRMRAPSRHAKRLAAMVAEKKISSVMELGCGAGFSLAYIAAANRGVTCAGCDADETMLAFAAKTHGDGVRWTLNGDDSIPLPDDSFEFIYSEGSLHHFLKPEKMFSEMKRILKPGGDLLVMDINPDSFFSVAYKAFVKMKTALGLSNPGEGALVLSMENALKEGRVVDIMKKCGMDCVTEKSLAALYYKWRKPENDALKR